MVTSDAWREIAVDPLFHPLDGGNWVAGHRLGDHHGLKFGASRSPARFAVVINVFITAR